MPSEELGEPGVTNWVLQYFCGPFGQSPHGSLPRSGLVHPTARARRKRGVPKMEDAPLGSEGCTVWGNHDVQVHVRP